MLNYDSMPTTTVLRLYALLMGVVTQVMRMCVIYLEERCYGRLLEKRPSIVEQTLLLLENCWSPSHSLLYYSRLHQQWSRVRFSVR